MPTSEQFFAEALVAAGFDPPPHIGQDWIDRRVTWLPDGHLSIVRIVALGNAVSGWQARIVRRQVDADGNTVPSGDSAGIIHVQHLVHRDSMFHYEPVPTD